MRPGTYVIAERLRTHIQVRIDYVSEKQPSEQFVTSAHYFITSCLDFRCWMDADAFYGAFLAPVLLLMAVNAFIFLAVMKEIYNIPHMCEKANRLSHFRATVSVFFLLGLNWLFAGLAAIVGTLLFHYLFTITCSFQGFVIFLLHGILKKDFQEAWRLFTTKNRVMEMIRTSSFGTQMSKTLSMSSQSSSVVVQGRDNPISLSGSRDGDSGIQVQVNTSIIITS